MRRALKSRYGDWDLRLTLWGVTVACSIVLGIPLLFVLFSSFRGPPDYLPIENGAIWTLENFSAFFNERVLYTRILPNTLILSVTSVAISCSIALALAWGVERSQSRLRIPARLLILAPMALPTPALAIAWIRLFGPQAGLVNVAWRSLTGAGDDFHLVDIFSMPGLIWCQATAGIPIAYLLLAPAVRSLRQELEEAGFVAGAGRAAVFRLIHLPTAFRSFVGPLLVMFLVALEQVDFPYIIGPTAGIQVLGTRILLELSSPSGLPNFGGTSAAAMLMLMLSAVGLIVHDRLVRQKQRILGASPRMTGMLRNLQRKSDVPVMCVVGGYVLVVFAVPLAVLILQAQGHNAGVGLSCCLNGFASIAQEERFWRALANTLIIATSSALIATMIGLLIAVSAADKSNGVALVLDKLSLSSVAIPPVVVGFGASVLFLSIPIGVYGTVGMLVIAYSYRIALATRLASGAIAQLGTTLQEAAHTSGIRWMRTQVSIVVPLVFPSIVSSAALLFVVGVKEFTIPLMLYSPDNVVLSVLFMQLNQAGNPAAAAASGLTMTVVGLLGIAVLVYADRLLERRTGSR